MTMVRYSDSNEYVNVLPVLCDKSCFNVMELMGQKHNGVVWWFHPAKAVIPSHIYICQFQNRHFQIFLRGGYETLQLNSVRRGCHVLSGF